MDESLFTHINNTQQWVVGMINITAKNIRIEIVNDRTTETLKMIIAKHLGKGNIILFVFAIHKFHYYFLIFIQMFIYFFQLIGSKNFKKCGDTRCHSSKVNCFNSDIVFRFLFFIFGFIIHQRV